MLASPLTVLWLNVETAVTAEAVVPELTAEFALVDLDIGGGGATDGLLFVLFDEPADTRLTTRGSTFCSFSRLSLRSRSLVASPLGTADKSSTVFALGWSDEGVRASPGRTVSSDARNGAEADAAYTDDHDRGCCTRS